MRTKLYTLVFAIMAGTQFSTAQTSPELDKGDYAFDHFDFEEALFFFQVANDAMPNEPTITRRIANTYRRIGDLAKSAEWYSKTIALNGAEPEDKLYYAEALKYLGQYDDAVAYYDLYNQQRPGDSRAMSHLHDRHYYKDLFADTARYKMKKLSINNENPVIGITLFEDEKLLVSAVNLENGKTQEVSPFLDVYLCEFSDLKELNHPEKLDKKVNSKFHDGPVFYSFSEHRLYITRNNIRNGKPVRDKNGNVNLKIYAADFQNGEWTSAQEMKFNGDGFSTGHACVSKDGQTMYLVSTREGGAGGSDIYQCFKTGSGWSAPINLGPVINTPGNEMFPYIGDDNNLYFASDGHAGLGGLDIFKSVMENGIWSKPMNLGSPINSCMDDFALVYDKDSDNGYFCSNRAGNGDDNIYFYEHITITKMTLAGLIKADDPQVSMAGEKIKIMNLSNGSSYEQELDEHERFEISVGQGEIIEISLTNPMFDLSDSSVLSYHAPENINDPYVNLGTNTIALKKVESRGAVSLASNNEKQLVKSISNLSMEDLEMAPEPAGLPVEPIVDLREESTTITDAHAEVIHQEDERISPYYELIEAADKLYAHRDLDSALSKYQQGLVLKPMSKYPIDQIEKIKKIRQEEELNRFRHIYQNLIIKADEQFSKKEYAQSILTYTEATQMLPSEEYPRIQIEKIQLLLHPQPKPEIASAFANVEIDLASMNLNQFIFSYKSTELSEEYYRVLDGLVKLMNENPSWILVIESHTDSRGSMQYNQKLSVDRAQTVEKYLILKGISRERLQAHCYGESRPSNGCKDGVECDEEQHEQNRRIDYRFVTKNK